MRKEWSHKLKRTLRIYPDQQEAAAASQRGEQDVLTEDELAYLMKQKLPAPVLEATMAAKNILAPAELWYAGKSEMCPSIGEEISSLTTNSKTSPSISCPENAG